MEEETKHTIKVNSQGKVARRMWEAFENLMNQTMVCYAPENAQICVPVLSI